MTITNTHHPFPFSPITNPQIARAISRTSPHKALGPDSIPNSIYLKCSNLLVPHLGPIYRATFNISVYPKEWQDSSTVVLRKPGKSNYTKPGAYRPIALINSVAKILSACVAEDPTNMAEILQLLPANHFGCRPGRTTSDSLHYVTKYTKDMWRKGDVVSALFLDIKGAFPSIILSCLIHDMRYQGILPQYTDWIH